MVLNHIAGFSDLDDVLRWRRMLVVSIVFSQEIAVRSHSPCSMSLTDEENRVE